MTAIPDHPTFELVDHDGHRVTESDYRGTHVMLFFGFTHCKKICPRALGRLTDVLRQLGPAADRIRALYVTVDPERDSPPVMKQFLAEHAPAFTGLTGTAEEITAIRSTFRVFAKRVDDPEDPDGYDMPHTAITYILGPDGRFLTHFGDGVSTQSVVSRMNLLLDEAKPAHR